ncbi:hypothetical protein PHMEG_0007637 [Phytophthora megakarya]|uniref:Reverse transcriptase Ty1/copia-type domain-containing protein n=1 Tax=Phytophthora megakarya TaxID=4795 RepID=A0A225WMS7_9STRA|nr:hypothetical protein PHMEG_0007637 [Phytophthora megakarya]
MKPDYSEETKKYLFTGVLYPYISKVSLNERQIAAKSEDKFHMNNNAWEVIPRPRKQKIVRSLRVFVVKYTDTGEIDDFKARLEYDIAYKITLPDFAIRQMDVKIAFLNCFLVEIYIALAEGFTVPGNDDLVCKTPIEPLRVTINSPLPGIKRCLQSWISQVHKGLLSVSTNYGRCHLLYRGVKYLLGWAIQHDRKNRMLFLHQQKYATKVIDRFSDYIPYPIAAPADHNFKLSVSSLPTTEAEKDAIKVLSYREAVDRIMYLMAMYPIGQCIKHHAREPSRQRDSVQFCQRICDYAIKQSDRMASAQTPQGCFINNRDRLDFAITNANHIYVDNQSCIKKCYNPEKVERHEFSITYCNTKDMIADTLTKAQDKHPFRDLRTKLRMIFPAR